MIGLMIVACGSSQPADQDMGKLIGGDAEEKAAEAAKEDAKKEAEQELVNFECTIPGDQKFYFYKGDMKTVTPTGEVWIVDDKIYAKIDLGGHTYLMQQEAPELNVGPQEAIDTYKNSKTLPGYDCSLGTVKASDVELPNLEILDENQLQEKLMEDMMAEYQ